MKLGSWELKKRRPAGLSLILLTLLGPCLALDLGLSPAPALNLSKSYEPHFRPNHGAVADIVSVSLGVLGLSDLRPDRMELKLDYVLRQVWTDPRIAHTLDKTGIFVHDLPNLWTPDLYFLNALSSESPDPNSRFMKVKPEGEVLLSQRLVSQIHCPMSFLKFPFDRQTCIIKIQSYAYTTLHLDMVWKGLTEAGGVPFFDPDYSLISIDTSSDKERRADGEYRTLQVSISFGRSGFKYLRRLLVPTLLLALFSYLTLFLIPKTKTRKKMADSNVVGAEASQHAHGHAHVQEIQFPLIRLSINGLLLLAYILVVQVNFLGGPSVGCLTVLDLWLSVTGLIVFSLFFHSILILILLQRNLIPTESGKESRLGRVQNLLTYGIPIFLLVFLTIYFAAVLI